MHRLFVGLAVATLLAGCGGTKPVDPVNLLMAPYTGDVPGAMVEGFLSSVRAGALLDPCASGEDGVRALEVALAGYRSAADGTAVGVR